VMRGPNAINLVAPILEIKRIPTNTATMYG